MVFGTPIATTSGADPLNAVPVPPLGPTAPPADSGLLAASQGSVAPGRAPGAGGIDTTVPPAVGDVPAIPTPGAPDALRSGAVSTGLPAELPTPDANLTLSPAAPLPQAHAAAAPATATPGVPDEPAPGTPATTATPATMATPGTATPAPAAAATAGKVTTSTPSTATPDAAPAASPAMAATSPTATATPETPASGTVTPAMATQPTSAQATLAEIIDGPVAVRQIAPEQGTAAAAGTLAPAAFSSVPAFIGATQLATNSTVPVAPSGAPAPFSLPAPVHEQVFTAVSPLLRAADGSYGVRLQLHPQDLGAVQVIVDVRHGEISIQMHSTDAAARDALRGGLSDLRQQLEGQGLSAGSMEVGSGGANARQPETPWSRPGTAERHGRGDQSPDRNVAASAAAASTSLDLRM